MQEATQGSLYSIIGNTGLITKVYIPKYIFPIAKAVSALVNFLFSLIALALVALLTGIQPSIALLITPLLFLSVFIFVLGLSMIFSTYTVFFRDLIHFHSIFLLIWMYLTPIFYPENILPKEFAKFMFLNPMYDYIKCFRIILLEGRMPPLGLLSLCFFIGIFFLVLGMWVFKRNQSKFLLYF
jgi:ABC-type polysaccharide/polyol phosphate export permease